MAQDVELAVEVYQRFGQWLLDHWSAWAMNVAAQLDSGTVTVDQAVADAAAFADLSVRSSVLSVLEAFEAAAVLTGEQDLPHTVPSVVDFETSNTPNIAGQVRNLLLAGPLVADVGSDSLPESVVTIVPTQLQPNEVQFSLVADATGHAGVGYSGTVKVIDVAGNLLESVAVWLLA